MLEILKRCAGSIFLSNQSLNSIGSLILGLLLFAAILAASYIAVRYFGKRRGFRPNGSRNITIIEKAYLAQDKVLFIVKVCGKVLLISAAQNDIKMLSELDEELLQHDEGNPSSSFEFTNILKSIINKKSSGKEGNSNNEDDK